MSSLQTWIGDGLPFDRERVKRVIREAEARILEDIISIGTYLTWAKSELPHGEFMRWLQDDVGMPHPTARKRMLVAGRANSPTAGNLLEEASGNSIERAVELCAVPDADIVRAVESGIFLGRPLDEISRMPVRELRAEIRALKKKESPAPVVHVEDCPEATIGPAPIHPLERAFQQAVEVTSHLRDAAIAFSDAREASPASPPLSPDEVKKMFQTYGYAINRHLARAHSALMEGGYE